MKLMQGNWVMLPHFDNHIAQVREIKPHGIWVDIKGEQQFAGLSEFVGVPLTPEVLDKCPQLVVMDGLGNFSYDDCFRFTWKPQYNYFYVQSYACRDYITKIEFVHELQNFISVVHNTELIVNL